MEILLMLLIITLVVLGAMGADDYDTQNKIAGVGMAAVFILIIVAGAA